MANSSIRPACTTLKTDWLKSNTYNQVKNLPPNLNQGRLFLRPFCRRRVFLKVRIVSGIPNLPVNFLIVQLIHLLFISHSFLYRKYFESQLRLCVFTETI